MDWPTWVIPLIAVAIWVISNIARNAGAGQQGQPRPAPRPRAAKSDIERFLEEINQRRRQPQQPAQQQKRAQPAAPPARRPEPAKQQPQTRRPAPRPRPSQVQPQPVREVSGPELLEPRPFEHAVPTVLPSEPTQVTPVLQSIFRPSQVQVTARDFSVHLRELRKLVSSSSGMRTAIMLHEVLGPPRCRRPFARHMGPAS